MSHLFKATQVFYDAKKQEMVNGNEIVINMDHVVKFYAAEFGGLIISNDVSGKILWVETINDHSGHSLRVTSKYLESLLKHTE